MFLEISIIEHKMELQTRSLKEWIADWFNGPATIAENQNNFITLMSFVLWHVWKLRCAVVFDGAVIQIDMFVRQVNRHVNDWKNNSVRRRGSVEEQYQYQE
ncbi:uncharacterized protein LOC113274190 [Papaver somniferum]|uniref:uncharacterized protein LOC113274190 n=1 Tax=Papaver somniferum TaxID=3469 RepID=UPI000E6FA686|nr:uncharacterized protein LOC113274190 [Papaver somniferum]